MPRLRVCFEVRGCHERHGGHKCHPLVLIRGVDIVVIIISAVAISVALGQTSPRPLGQSKYMFMIHDWNIKFNLSGREVLPFLPNARISAPTWAA